MAPTLLCLIRHAQSTWNAARRWQGHGDPPLSELGREQADALAHEVGSESLDAIVSSDLGRTRETAGAIARRTGLEVQVEPGLRELDVGCWSGLTAEQIGRAHAETLVRFASGDLDARAGGGETRRELSLRVRVAADSIAAAHSGQRVAVVTHLGVIRALAAVESLPNAGRCWLEWPADPSLAVAASGPSP